MPIFTKNINIWAPWNFLKMKTLTRMRLLACAEKFGFGLLKSYLTFSFVDLF